VDVLIDAGPIIALFDERDDRHDEVITFLAEFTGQFITTCPVITECMWLLSSDWRVQNELLTNLANEIYDVEPFTATDFKRIVELNTQYRDHPADFADLSLIAISERLQIPKIVTFDGDFDVYRRFKHGYFERIGF
jgi:predicted nucleic acid-binding protein